MKTSPCKERRRTRYYSTVQLQVLQSKYKQSTTGSRVYGLGGRVQVQYLVHVQCTGVLTVREYARCSLYASTKLFFTKPREHKNIMYGTLYHKTSNSTVQCYWRTEDLKFECFAGQDVVTRSIRVNGPTSNIPIYNMWDVGCVNAPTRPRSDTHINVVTR